MCILWVLPRLRLSACIGVAGLICGRMDVVYTILFSNELNRAMNGGFGLNGCSINE